MSSPALAVLTRPAGRNEPLGERLRALGWRVLELPALEVRPLRTPREAIPLPESGDLVVFVSGTAVECYFRELRDVVGMQQWPAGIATACVGPGTARAIRQSPFWAEGGDILHPGPGSPSFDSEALWQLLRARGPLPRRVLLVRGTQGRDWLAARLAGEGVDVHIHAVYERGPAAWPAAAVQALRACRDGGVAARWLLSSGEGVRAAAGQARHAGLLPWWQACSFVLTHPRLADRLREQCAAAQSPAVVKICLPDEAAIVQAFCS